ncbi:MAG: hypothetical protein QHG98_07295 [Methanothrix sp.]|jgi:hypothetical protein|nr:hypothetical protein [Methanothrix sp.]
MIDLIAARRECRAYKHIAIAIAVLYIGLIAALVLTDANVIEFRATGEGMIYSTHSSANAGETAGVDTGEFAYTYKVEWSEGFSKVTSVFVAKAEGGYGDQYVVTARGAGHTITYEARQIAGNFSGNRDFTLYIRPDDQNENLDQHILVQGNMTLVAKIRATDRFGRPLDNETVFLRGKALVDSYVNLTKPYPTPGDWLGLCTEIEKKWGV